MTVKLNFDYDNSLDCEVAHHNGYRIKEINAFDKAGASLHRAGFSYY